MSETGLLPITLEGNGAALCPPSTIRVIPPGPQVPRVIALSDGINLMSGTRIVTGIIKATIEETGDPSAFQAWIDGQPVKNIDIFCADPLPPRYEINFEPPDGIDPGTYQLVMQLQNRRLAPISIEIT
jgi:hypothetical protein